MTILSPFSEDVERRAAHRTEKKRALAKIEVQRETLAGLQNILAKLNADSDQAAESHQIDAGKLQAELDDLDARQIDCVMCGKAVPTKDVVRRGQILEELSKLNTALELRCEANRRAALPVQKQISDLRIQIGKAQAIQNELSQLCSPEIRRKRKLNALRMQMTEQLAREIGRQIDIHHENLRRMQIDRQRGMPHDTEYVQQQHLSDCEWMQRAVSADIAGLHATDRAIEAEALSE